MRRILMFASAFILMGALSVSIGGVTSATADIIVNGGFELPGYAAAFTPIITGVNDPTGWTVVNAQIVNQTFPGGWQAAEGVQSLNLNGPFQSSLALQVPNVSPGGVYQLNFALAGTPGATTPNTVNLRLVIQSVGQPASILDYAFDVNGKTAANMGWVNLTTPPIPMSGGTLVQFINTTPAGSLFSPVIDKISLAQTPEPSSMALMGLGLAVVGGLSRRRRKQTKA